MTQPAGSNRTPADRRRRIRIALELVVLVGALAVLILRLRIADRQAPLVPVEGRSAGTDARGASPSAGAARCAGARMLAADQHHAAAELCVEVVAHGTGSLRQIAFAPDGDLFGALNDSQGSILRLRDADGDGAYQREEVEVWATTGGNGNNVHIDAEAGFLYAGTPDGVRRFPWAPDRERGGEGEDVVVGQPDGGHGFHTAHVYDGFLYVQSGSAGNATNDEAPAYDTTRSLIKRFDLAAFEPGHPFAWSEGEVWTVGLRNTVGFTRDRHGRLWGVVNGLDELRYAGIDVHHDNPGEQVVWLRQGAAYGYPFCFTAQRIERTGGGLVPAGTQLENERFRPGHDDAWCAERSEPPQTFLQAHSAPLEIAFLDAPTAALPARWVGGAFVSLHGSWDRGQATGYKVVWIPFDEEGMPPMPVTTAAGTSFPYEVVLGGGTRDAHVDGPWAWTLGDLSEGPVRPVGLAVSPVDGALYVSSDNAGTLYRLAEPVAAVAASDPP